MASTDSQLTADMKDAGAAPSTTRTDKTRHRQTALRAAWYLFVFSIGVLATVLAFQFARRETWSPLGPYPEQQIKSPLVRYGESQQVRGTKCNQTDKPVRTQGRLDWQTVKPGGRIVFVQRGVGVRAPGCTELAFDNPMPPSVITVTNELRAEGFKKVVWRISGSDTPIRDDGEEGTTVYWHTEPFEVAP